MFWRHAVADPRGTVPAGPEGAASHAIPGATPSGPAACVWDGGFWGLILCSLCWRIRLVPGNVAQRLSAWISTLELSKRDSVLE